MSRVRIPLSECGLLSRTNARLYCGGLGEERFDREVGPHVRPRLLGSERFYSRKELDAWIDGAPDPVEADRQELTRILDRMEAEDRASAATAGQRDDTVLALLRATNGPCTTQQLEAHVMTSRGAAEADSRGVKAEDIDVRTSLQRLKDKGLVRRAARDIGRRVAYELIT